MKSLILTLVAVTTCLGQTSFYVGLGNSSPYTDSTGQFWQADSGCTTSTQFTSNATIQGTADPTLYQHGRSSSGNFSCTYAIQNNIYYTVTLKFANVQGVASGGRTFNIVINNQVVRSGFDIGSISNGVNAAFDLGFVVPVSNGQIAISLLTTTGGTQLNAIGITPLNSTSLTTGNFNNIRIVDGVKFAQTAGGINAADADLGAGNAGEIWVPSGSTINASDAQISITSNHLLKIFGRINIEAAASKGPILLAGGAGITCSVLNISAGTIGEITPSATITSMVRLAAQDGSQGFNFVQGCNFAANTSTVSNGVIDFTGTQTGWIRDNYINNLASGFGIFIQDNQTGALAGTNNVQIVNNRISTGPGTGGCLELLHSSTNAVTISNIDITDLACTPGTTSGNSVTVVNADATASHLRQIYLSNVIINGTPVGASSISLGGVQQAALKGISCFTGSSCVTITSSALNGVITLDSILNYGASNTLLDQSAANVTITTSSLLHYDFPIGNTGQVSYLNNVSFLKVQGLSPSATVTGCGTGCAITPATQATNNAGVFQLVAGTTPGASGTVTINFNVAQSTFGINTPSCVFQAHNTTGTWNPRVSFIITNVNPSLVAFAWDNNAVNLVATSQYNIHYWCSAH